MSGPPLVRAVSGSPAAYSSEPYIPGPSSISEGFDKIIMLFSIPTSVVMPGGTISHYTDGSSIAMIFYEMYLGIASAHPEPPKIKLCSTSTVYLTNKIYITQKKVLYYYTPPQGQFSDIDIDKFNANIDILRTDVKKKFDLDSSVLNDFINFRKLNKNLSKNGETISGIKERLKSCPFNMIYVPLTLINLNMSVTYIPDHANALLIGKNGDFIIVEPEKNTEKSIAVEPHIREAIIKLVKKVIDDDKIVPRELVIEDSCPQGIINKDAHKLVRPDENCIFWSMFLTIEIIKNSDGIVDQASLNKIINYYSKLNRGTLQKLIYDFKINLITQVIPQVLSKSKVAWPDFQKIYDEHFTPEKLVAGRRKTRKNKKRTLRKKRKSSKK